MPHSVDPVVMTLLADESYSPSPQPFPFMNGIKSPGGGINGNGSISSTPKVADQRPLSNGRPASSAVTNDGSSITDSVLTPSIRDGPPGSRGDRTPTTKMTPPTSSQPESSYFPNTYSFQNTAAPSLQPPQNTIHNSRPGSPSHSVGTANGTVTSSMLDAPAPRTVDRFPAPPALSTQTGGALPPTPSSPLAPVPPGPGGLRHRHTLQVPIPSKTNRNSTSSNDAITSGRFSPTTAVPRRASTNLGRRGSRSIQSDLHVDGIPQDEDAHRWTEAIKAKRASKRRKREEDDDRVVVGTKVDQNHANWVTAYNMLTGIRFVVSRVNAKMDRPLTDADFESKHKFSFDITGNELTPSAKYDFKFKDYAPWVFRSLRAKFGLDPADYLMSLTSKYILSELGSPGKSGSFFYFSRDYKYIIKTIHHGEHRFLRKILREYYTHIENNPNTLVSQFYGLHRVKTPFGRKIHFVVMNNLFPPHRDIHQTFDLKGSTIGRDYKEENLAQNPRATLKDLNWLRRDMHLEFGPHKKEEFLTQVERDVRLLQRLGIMDYSLLIGIHDLTRGNKDDIRHSALKVFQPGVDTTDELKSTDLVRTPSKMESARKAREMRKLINKEVPVTLDRAAERLPDEFADNKQAAFYRDDGGYQATHDNDNPGEVIYYLGIIDCLTHYGLVKKMEHFWRGLSNPKNEVSAIPPQGYGERFLNFIRKAVMSPEEAAKEKARKEAERAAAATAAEVQEDNNQEAPKGESRENATRSPEPHVTLGTIKSPSPDGASGTILPVVEETGEGSIGSRTRSANDSATDVTTHRERPTSSMSNLDKPLPHRPDSMPPLPVQQFSYVEKQSVQRTEFTGGIARVSS